MLQTQAVDLLREGDRVSGVRVQTPQGEREIRAQLVVACDGRHSTLRDRAQLRVIDIAAPIDALWLRLSKHPNDPPQTFGNIVPGGILVAIDRRDYYQCAFVIRKGGMSELQARGIEAFRQDVATAAPFLQDRVDEIASWDDVKLLTVKIDRLERWWLPGLLCIGDAAHAMSPVGGIGINLAIQDAVAAANILTPALQRGELSERHLRAVQQRREFPTKATQWLQMEAQNRVLNQVLQARKPIHIPGVVRFLTRFATMRRIPARIIGVGIRPEHVRSYAVTDEAIRTSSSRESSPTSSK
jgi:2-polyprenyl-6-methoxyphenol hydroxylase-like FAD-dependent oxidoreductase